MAGRPAKLTPEVQDKIVSMLRAGNYAAVAYTYAGICRRTYESWIKRGERESSGIYHEFANAVARAESEAEARHVVMISTAAKSHWKAAAWLLARRNPDRWAASHTVRVEVQRGVEHVLDAVREHMSRDAYVELVNAIAAISGVDTADSDATAHSPTH
jgi:hypothetical protein